MENTDAAKMVYLSVLGATLIGTVLISNRGHLLGLFRQAGVWLLIFAAVVAIGSNYHDILYGSLIAGAKIGDDGTITIPRGAEGHFRITLEVNDKPVEFLIDTGASEIVLTQQDAIEIGFKPKELDYWGTANTANGVVGIAKVRLAKVRAGIYLDRNIRASVNEGSMETSLLGMHYLKLFSNIEIKQDKMILKR